MLNHPENKETMNYLFALICMKKIQIANENFSSKQLYYEKARNAQAHAYNSTV